MIKEDSLVNDEEIIAEEVEDTDLNKENIEILEEDSVKIVKKESIRENLLEHYILGKTIGQGSFGKVKIGIHKLTKEKVAVKVLEKSKFDDDDIKNLKKEIGIIKRIRHKNINQFYEMIDTENKMFLIMDLAENGDFFDLISQKIRFNDEREACKYFHQIIIALEYLHSLNIVHRDIKPENMLIDSKYEIKLTDFGLSSTYKDDQLLSTPCGTPNYAAPELIKGEQYHGMFSDIWSAGVVLYSMLCGYLPFGDSNENLLQNHIIKCDYEIPSFVSEDAKELIQGILKLDPLERFDFDLIKSSRWFRSIDYIFYPGIFIDKHHLPIDEKILDLIENIYNIDRKTVKFHLLNYDFNEFTSTYYMMLKRFIKEGGKSISDLISKDYLDYIQDPKNIYNYDNFLEISIQNESLNISEISVVNDFIKNSSSILVKTKINKLLKSARKSLTSYYTLIKSKTNEKLDQLTEFDKNLLSNRERKTIFKRTDAVISNLFLDLLERKTLKRAENEETDSDKLIEEYLEKKNYLEYNQRKSVRFNYENILNDEKDFLSNDDSENLSCEFITEKNNDDFKNINVDAEYRIPDDIVKISPIVKKTPQIKNDKNNIKLINKPPIKKKIDPKQYNIYINKKIHKKEKSPDNKENTIIKINIQFGKNNKEPSSSIGTNNRNNNVVSQHSKGNNTTGETIVNKNIFNSSINEGVTLQTEGNYIQTIDDTGTQRSHENSQTPNNINKKYIPTIPKGNKTLVPTQDYRKERLNKTRVPTPDNRTERINKLKFNGLRDFSGDNRDVIDKKTHSNDRKNNHFSKFNQKPIKVSDQINKSKAEESRSRSPNFNTKNGNYYKTDYKQKINYTNEFLTFLTTHNKAPYGTKKTRFNCTPIKIKEYHEINNTESSLVNSNDLEENKIKDNDGPIDISCCFSCDIESLHKHLIKILNKQRIIYINKKHFIFRCSREGVKVKIDLFTIKDSKLTYTKFQRIQGTSFEYQQVTSKILNDLRIIFN